MDERVREVVILAVGAVWKSHYDVYAHSAVARTLGIPESALQKLAIGLSFSQLRPKEQLAQRFAHQLAAEYKVASDLYREAGAAFGQTGLLEMTYSALIFSQQRR